MNDSVKTQKIDVQEQSDSIVDAVAAIVLIVIFVSACIFWVSTQ